MTSTIPPVSETAPDGTSFTLTGPDGAPVLALIHGLGLCRHVWDGMLPCFAGFRVLNYDLYGHGASAPPPAQASLTVYSDQLAGLMDHLGIASAHVIGFSIGGMINRRFALDHGDLLQSLVILNSPHDRGEKGQTTVEERAKTVRDQGAMATMDAALKRWFTPEYLESAFPGPQDRIAPDPPPRAGAMPPPLGRGRSSAHGATLVRNWRNLVDPESYAQAAWVLANGVRELIAPDPPISAPTLVMTCENDSGSTPAMSRAIAQEIDGAHCQIIPRLQHLGLMEEPNAFSTPILSFLERIKK